MFHAILVIVGNCRQVVRARHRLRATCGKAQRQRQGFVLRHSNRQAVILSGRQGIKELIAQGDRVSEHFPTSNEVNRLGHVTRGLMQRNQVAMFMLRVMYARSNTNALHKVGNHRAMGEQRPVAFTIHGVRATDFPVELGVLDGSVLFELPTFYVNVVRTVLRVNVAEEDVHLRSAVIRAVRGQAVRHVERTVSCRRTSNAEFQASVLTRNVSRLNGRDVIVSSGEP